MTDLYEPLRQRLRELGWVEGVKYWSRGLWRDPDGVWRNEASAFAWLAENDADAPNPASEADRG